MGLGWGPGVCLFNLRPGDSEAGKRLWITELGAVHTWVKEFARTEPLEKKACSLQMSRENARHGFADNLR